MEPLLLFLIPGFFIAALLYASVGFGGGSTYLALLTLSGLSYLALPRVSLICNIIVVSGGLTHYFRQGHLKLSRVLPFIVTSIPCAYLGGRLPISKEIFLFLLAFSLLVAGLRLLFSDRSLITPRVLKKTSTWMLGLTGGAVLGFLSGLVGIGGGIFLSPLLYFLRWGQAREIAAAASFFIFVNSLSGLLGQLNKVGANDYLPLPLILPLAFAVFAGGQIGSRLSVGRLSLGTIQRLTAMLILYVSGGIFWKVL